MMKLTDFYYDLPQELIAQDPLLKRSESRLMVLDRKDNTIEHKHFYDVIDYLNPGDCLVINDTRVLPARLMGVKEDTGASIEVLLLKRKDDCTWETLVKPGKKCKVGARIVFGSESNEPDPETGLIKGKLVGEVVDIVEEGNRLIRFEFDGIFEEILDELMAHNKAVDDIEKIVIYGYCTDICVISNAMVLRAAFPETEIEILSDCCAGVTPQSHQTALDAMRACQFTIV